MKHGKVTLAIVDDHQIVIDGLKSLLKGHNTFNVQLETTDPVAMIELLKKDQVDILLTDVMMPVMDGAELSKKVHQLPRL